MFEFADGVAMMVGLIAAVAMVWMMVEIVEHQLNMYTNRRIVKIHKHNPWWKGGVR